MHERIPRAPGRRLARAALLAALALPFAAPAAFATATATAEWMERAAEEVPRFRIERITVVGPVGGAARILVAESLLEAGHSYTEEELRQAVYRIDRLPFLVEADFALAKGSERGAYELVISARPAKNFFFDHSLQYTSFNRRLNLDGVNDTYELTSTGLAGVRLFVGSAGVLFGALDSRDGVQVGYTRYDLLDRGAVATVAYSRIGCCTREILPFGIDPNLAIWSWGSSGRSSVDLAVPLAGEQSLRLAWSERRGDASDRQGVFSAPFDPGQNPVLARGTLIDDRWSAKWTFDSSDDPVLPTRGLTAAAGIEAYWFQARRLERFLIGVPAATAPVSSFDGREVALAAEVVDHHPLTLRQILSLTLKASVGRSHVEGLAAWGDLPDKARFTTWGAAVGVKHSLRLWQQRTDRGFGDLRLETAAEVGREWIAPRTRQPSGRPLNRGQISTSLVFRNAWGKLRLGLAYLSLGGGGR